MRPALRFLLLALSGSTLVGCQTFLREAAPPPTAEPALSPTLERMRRAYPDLAAGKFVALADFNTPPQAELCRIVGPDGQEAGREQPAVSPLRSRDETGAGGLRAKLGPGDRLRLDGARSQSLALLRDWRPYALLLASVYGPAEGATLELTIESGTDRPLRWVRTMFVRPGWNLTRVDLAELTEAIDLADVRGITWRPIGAGSTTELFIDDVIIADNTHYLLGEQAAEGELYVFTRGRRTHVGARDRFEIALADGVIVSWTGGNGRNLAALTGIGPWPVALPDDWYLRRESPIAYDDPAQFSNWGQTVDAAQQTVEATALRAVIAGTWRFMPPPGQDRGVVRDNQPGHTWQYAIYPSGQAYLRIVSEARGAGWRQPRAGYAVAFNGRAGFERVKPAPSYAQRVAVNFVLLSPKTGAAADFLWAPNDPQLAGRQQELLSSDERRLAILVGDVEARDTVPSAHMLRFWPRDINSSAEAESFAADYQHPADLTMLAGGRVLDAAGDLNNDGFNESEGCYELSAAAGAARFRFEPGTWFRHDPIFRVHGTAGRPCWVYVDGRIVQGLGRDAAGELMFMVPRMGGRASTLEVVTPSQTTASGK